LDINLNTILTNLPVWVVLSAFIITYLSVPTIVKISKHKKLYDIPNERTSHLDEVPVLGGLSIFAGFTISLAICSLPVDSGDIRFIFGGVTILFFLGLKDDILMIDPKKKFLGQIIAATLIVVLGDMRITNFHSILGIDEIQYIPSVIFSIFLVLTLVNGFNLIDGVDGLAPGEGILVSGVFAVWFLITDQITFAMIALSLAGSLLAYVRFNVFSKRNKIFMGDTGSMITGLVVAVLTIKFLEYENITTGKSYFESAPAIAISLLILPLFDTLRIFILRIIDGGSPFKADKNHIHHLLLTLGFPHFKIALYLVSINFGIFVLVLFLDKLGNIMLISVTVIIATILTILLNIRIKRKVSKLNQ
jgi:UDP-GlcNAc:undecaprenyl-phosphate GlcNAc-1-phosphate transferase